MRRIPMSALGASALGAAALLLGACGTGAGDTGSTGVDVVVGFYPLQYLAETVGGADVTVTSLAQPGAEPHDLELSPRQIVAVADADLVLYLATLQPAVDDAVAQNAPDTSLDVLSATEVSDGYAELGEEDTGVDPHVWLDPTKYAQLAVAVGQRLGGADPTNAAAYTANAAGLVDALDGLDEEFRTGLADCARTQIVTTHNAFGYLAARYGLTQVGIVGISPEEEPSPQQLDDVQTFAADNGITTIFYEDAVSPEYAETIAAEIGADTAVLSPLEVVDEGEDYMSVMRRNLSTLETALGCR